MTKSIIWYCRFDLYIFVGNIKLKLAFLRILKYLFAYILYLTINIAGHQSFGHTLQTKKVPVIKVQKLAGPMMVQSKIVPEPGNLEVINFELVHSKLLDKSSSKETGASEQVTKKFDNINTYLIHKPVHISCILPLTEILPVPDNIYLAYDALLYSQLPPP